jgi:hypothetical protein
MQQYRTSQQHTNRSGTSWTVFGKIAPIARLFARLIFSLPDPTERDRTKLCPSAIQIPEHIFYTAIARGKIRLIQNSKVKYGNETTEKPGL